MQPDSIIPNLYNPQNLNRYSFVGNNSINRIDPSGHMYCDGENSENGCKGVTKDDLKKVVTYSYGWKLAGDRWSKDKINKLLDYASDFATDIYNLTGKDGATWIRNHVGDATIRMGSNEDWILNNIRAGGTEGMVPTYSDVLLTSSASGYSEHNFIHEMGHIFDNFVKGSNNSPAVYSGGGPADAMVYAMGGHPWGCYPRLQCRDEYLQPHTYSWYIVNIAGNSPWESNVDYYADTGVAEDFAETFSYTLMGNFVPSGRRTWMISFLELLP